VLRGLKFSNEERELAAKLVGVAAADEETEWTAPDVRRLLSDLGRDVAEHAVELWRADSGAVELIELASQILARGDAIAIKELALNGSELMTQLAMKPGPGVGRLLAALLDRVLEDPTLNTHAGLLELARHLELALARRD
jgi:tRNA nucleotidyltransferase (CCA-adding enzyme)